jgi:hypothetical protein
MFMKPGPTAVAQGRYYSTGNPEYDAFFVELHRLQVELKDAPDRSAEPRATLAKALDVGLDADVIKEALAKKASALNAHQIKFTVQPPATDKPATLHVTGSPSGADAALEKTLEDTLAKISELKTATDGWQKDLEPLPERATSLQSNVDTAFAGKSDRTIVEVKNNLSDGQKIIELLESRAKDAAHTNDELFGAITGALGEAPAANGEKASEPAAASAPAPSKETKGHKSSSAPEKPTKQAKAKPEPPPKAPAAKAAKPAPPPKAPEPKHAAKAPEPKAAAKAPEPKPTPKPAEPKPAPERSEVPPAPKPTQGTAKPDFEP